MSTPRAFRQERVEADYAGQTTANGGAIISTRDSVSLGFGLEQVTDTAARTELVRRMMLHLLPTTADAAAPTVSWLRPGENAEVNVADPVEIEVEAADERGDLKEVRLSVGDQLVQRKVSFPFQFRWQPTAGYVGQTVTLVVDAEDKAGNVTRSFRVIRVVSGTGIANAPLPTGVTTIAGTPAVGETLTCIPSGFTGDNVTLSYQWLRDGAAISGARSSTYVPVAGDVGTQVSCRVSATNSAGTADSTSSGRTISGPAAAPAPQAAPTTPAGGGIQAAAAPRLRVACVIRSYGVLCTLKASRLATKATIRVVGRKQRATASGRGTVHVRLKGKKVKRTARVEVRYTAGTATGKTVVRLGRTVTVDTKR